MIAVRNVPLFDKPGEEPMGLSKALAGLEHRLAKDEKAKWTDVRLKGYRPCQECAAVQHAQLWQKRDEEDSHGSRR